MKTLLLALFTLFAISSRADNYYLSSVSGDDSRTPAEAQHPSTPWKTINKINAIFSTLKPGDSILFKRGETFYGSLIVKKSGTPANPIVISAYGTGDRPVITGMQTLTNWISRGNGIYECTNPALGAQVNVVAINDVAHEMGRFPNSDAPNGGYLNFESHVNNASITDNDLTSSTVWTGAELVVRTSRYIIDRTKISRHSGNTISYSPALSYPPLNNFGYFIQNDIRTLDQFGEWYYNPATKKMSIYFGSKSPAAYTVKASAIENVIDIYSYSNIVLDNLNIRGGNSYSVYLYSNTNIYIKNCEVNFTGIDGISANNPVNITVENSRVLNSNNIGINISHSMNGIVRNNYVQNSGVFKGMGQNHANKSLGIRETGRNNLIENNQVEASGYIGIRFGGDYTTVRNNFVNGFNLTKDDGGGIYTTDNGWARKIENNIIINGTGASVGTNNASSAATYGIYLDDDANRVEVVNNTIANCNKSGIFLHNAHEITMRDNTMFDNAGEQLLMVHNMSSKNSPPLRNNVLKNNILFAKSADEGILNINTCKDDINQAAGTMDSNYYCRPLDDNFIIKTTAINSAGKYLYQDLDLEGWREVYNKDKRTRKTAVEITSHKLKALLGQNKFSNGDFSSSISGVNVGSTGNSFSKSWTNNEIDGGTFKIVTSSTKPGFTTATIPIGPVSTAKKYVVGFSVKNSKDTLIYVYVRQAGAPYKVLSNHGEKTILRMNRERKDYELAFTPTINEAKASLFLETPSQSSVWLLDNIKIYEADVVETNPDDSIRLEYNTGTTARKVMLDGTYTDPKGTVYKNSVVIEPFSSIILIKQNKGDVHAAVPPTITITAPEANAGFKANANITLSATANDQDGSVSKVEFYNGKTLLGSDNTSPYTFTWDKVAPGKYSITAKATDNSSLEATSEVVNISVAAPNKAPKVSITTPTPDASFTAPDDITINVAASDEDGTIEKVEFYNGDELLHTETTAPYGWSWNKVPAGKYVITAKATDNESSVTTSKSVSISVAKQNIAPKISITTPKPDASFTDAADITINVAASDEDGSVSKVEFYNGDKLLHTVTAAPYTWSWKNVPAGNYTLTAKAIDNKSAETSSSAVSVTVTKRNVAPKVTIVTPAPNAKFAAHSDITVNAEATDADGAIEKVEFYNGNKLMHTETSAPYTWTWTNVPAGKYSLTVKAVDDGALVTSSSPVAVAVTAANKAPKVSITTPVSDQSFTAHTDISINAAASDADGSVRKVEFYNGNDLLGSDNTSPYSYTWKNVPAGMYVITAKAIDNGSLTTASPAVAIAVSNPNKAPTVNITTPAADQTFPAHADVTINASAADADGSVTKVEFYDGNTLLHTETKAPHSWTWKNAPQGKHVITAKATDNSAFTTSSAPVVISVSEAKKAPEVSINSPEVNATYAGPATIDLAATATDQDGTISKVEFFEGDKLIKTEKEFPYNYTWKNVPVGKYEITAVATDDDGLQTTSAIIRVSVVKNLPPDVSLTSPVKDQHFTSSSTISLSAAATDKDGTIKKVEFFNGDTLLRTERIFPYTWSWKDVPAGKYTITAVATDDNGLTSSDKVSISVTENQAPEVQVITSKTNADNASSATITLSAVAKDPDGTIKKVEFYNGPTLIRTEWASPYSWTWKNVPAGTYMITAVAVDNNGLSNADSVPVTVGTYNRGVAAPPAIASTSVAETQGNLIDKIHSGTENSLGALSVKVGPNPATSVLSIYTYGIQMDKEIKLTVLSMSGKALTGSLAKTSGNAVQLNISSLAAGVYLLQVTVGNDAVYKQFVKQ